MGTGNLTLSEKKLKSGKEMKTTFHTISEELQDKAISFIEKLNAL